jgi:AcrR family transcriptional regulator
MPRPSQHIDRALLASGHVLYPANGCAGLSVRALAEHAGVNQAMFHYHFKTKNHFLRTLLQQMYDEMYAGLNHDAMQSGPAADRLHHALGGLARFVRDHRPVIARVWSDAAAGQTVAREFMRTNAPRHVGLLMQLLLQAEREGSVATLPPIQRLTFVMGSVVAPLVIVSGLMAMGITPGLPASEVEGQALSDAAIAQRVDLALRALRPGRGSRSAAPPVRVPRTKKNRRSTHA